MLHLTTCRRMGDMKQIYNFQQRISWLSHRWRTQRNAISNVNCRIQWIIESLNASCAPWYSEEHACLSVIKFSTIPRCGLDLGGFAGFKESRLPWKALAVSEYLWCDNYLCLGVYDACCFWTCVLRILLTNLTSNQVGLPAELKHINKRRKRN